jgi:glc operon protein GlcG
MLESIRLSHQDAMKVVDVVGRELESMGRSAAVAVCDDHGELVAFLRTDGCGLASINIAINKAFTAARERRSTTEVARTTKAEGVDMTAFGDLRYNPWSGGVPIMFEGAVVGAVGVSGMTQPEDAKLAEIGAAVI